MNKEFKGTKGIWRNPEGTTFITCGEKQICDYAGYKTTEDEDDANAQLIIDAGETIQSCGLLPSELLKQRDEMREILVNFHHDYCNSYETDDDLKVLRKYMERIEKYLESTEVKP